VLLRLLSAPQTLVPFAFGVTALAVTWALDMNAPMGVFAGLAGLLIAGGSFLSQLVTRGEDYARDEVQRLRQEAHAAQERQLDDLYRRLRADKDPRTESALHDLRGMERAFHELSAAKVGTSSRASVAIVAGVEELVDRCVESLEESLRLWHMARGLQTPAARMPILKQREQIVTEVIRSTEQLGKILAAMQELGASTETTAELTRVREELDQSLAVARAVDERMKEFAEELAARERE
jgi:hypothetical protein